MKCSRWYLFDSDESCKSTVAELRDVDGEVAGWVFAVRSEEAGSWRVGFSTDFEDGFHVRGAAEAAAEAWAFMLAEPALVV